MRVSVNLKLARGFDPAAKTVERRGRIGESGDEAGKKVHREKREGAVEGKEGGGRPQRPFVLRYAPREIACIGGCIGLWERIGGEGRGRKEALVG